MDTRLCIGVVGCGYWGVNYVRIFNELPDTRVVAACDQMAERLKLTDRWFPGVQFSTDLATVINDPVVDAVVVCTPASTHYDIASRCLAAGKHVLIEKPITTSVSDADDLIRMAEAKGVVLMVGHTFLYHSAVRKLKEYIRNGEAGRVYYLYSRRTNMGPIRHDVNALWDLSPHDITIFNYLLDQTPEWVSAVGARVLRNGREDVGFVSLGYPSDVVAHIHVSWADAYKVREVVVVGSERRIVFNDVNPLELVRVFHKGVALVDSDAPTFGENQLQMRDGDIVSPRIEVSEPLKNQCSHFIECIRTGSTPLSDSCAGRDVVRVMHAIDASVRQKGAPVRVMTETKSSQTPADIKTNGHAHDILPKPLIAGL
jgi:predicted dehydrogenase